MMKHDELVFITPESKIGKYLGFRDGEHMSLESVKKIQENMEMEESKDLAGNKLVWFYTDNNTRERKDERS